MSEKQTEEALPMFNRDEIATEAGFFDVMFRLHDIKRECVMPAKVEKYDRSTRLATIKPLVQKFKTTQGGKVFWDRDSYEEIPVVSPFHGGFTIDFPVNEGDQGYLIAIDRPWDEIFDTIQEKGKEWDGKPSKPDDESLATFEQGVFIPSNYGRILIDDEDEGNLVIARVDKDGNVDGRIAVGDRFMDIDMDTTVHGSLTIKDDKRDRKAVVDAKDLGDTDAKFREVTVVTGFKEKVGKIVKLFAKKFRVLADEQIDGEDVEFEVGGGGGGGAKLKLKYGDDAPVVYDGEEEKEFFVPAPPEPIVPGDGTLSMKVNGVEQAIFTANQNTNSEFNVVIPTPAIPEFPEHVETLNNRDSKINIIGGEKISVSTVGQTITISFNEVKTEPDQDPQHKKDPCEHDKESGNMGGVDPTYQDVVSPDRIIEDRFGGVQASPGGHIGDDNCQRSKCE